MKSYIILILLSFISSIAFANQSIIHWPNGNINILSSANGDYTIENTFYNVDYDPSKPNFKLFLKNSQDTKRQEIFSYSRHVDVAWNNFRNFFINDYGGSDFADCVVFTLNEKIEKISMLEQLKKQFPSNKTIFKNDHVYITCDKWLDNESLLIKIYGHGEVDKDGFTLWYKYTLNKNLQFIKKEL